MLVSLTVGKVDAGVAVLLTEDKRLIEFPSILLPSSIHSGSIVDINVTRNHHAEALSETKFTTLQNEIYAAFGSASPQAPVLRCRNTTQTSVVLEWDALELATSELRSLSLYRNGMKVGVIPAGKLSTKISGLGVDTEYTFHLILRTSAGQFSSGKLALRTHKMTDLTGITVTPGVMPNQLRDSLAETLQRIGAKLAETVRIDTTHFVCTEPRGQAWEKAVDMNVPVVVPDWVHGCEREGRLVGVRGYYLDADPKYRQLGTSVVQQNASAQNSGAPGQAQGQGRPHSLQVQAAQRFSQRDSPRIEHTPPTPERVSHRSRQDAEDAEVDPPTPPPKQRSEAERVDAGTTVVSKEAESEEDDESEGVSGQDSGREEEQEEISRLPIEHDEDGRDVVAEQEATGEDGRFDEVAL